MSRERVAFFSAFLYLLLSTLCSFVGVTYKRNPEKHCLNHSNLLKKTLLAQQNPMFLINKLAHFLKTTTFAKVLLRCRT